MTRIQQLEQVRLTIQILENFEESSTEPFRIVLITLKQKEAALEKEIQMN